MTPLITAKQKLIKEVMFIMGHPIIDVGLPTETYETAYELALDRYRQRSVNATEERIAFLDLVEGQNSYSLADEVITVRQIYRSGVAGTYSGTGAYFEPFGAGFITQFVMAGQSASGAGGLATYELFSEYENILSRMFGGSMDFIWNYSTHKLDLQRNIRGPETIGMLIDCFRPEELLLSDPFSRVWLRDYTTAKAKAILGEARSKFGSFGGPQGAVTLNGSELKNEAAAEFERLEKEISTQVDASSSYGFLFRG